MDGAQKFCMILHVVILLMIFLTGLGIGLAGELGGFQGAILGGVVLGLVLCLGWLIYMMPYMIACIRGLANQGMIFVANLLLGGTGIVWIICLIFAFSGDKILGKNE